MCARHARKMKFIASPTQQQASQSSLIPFPALPAAAYALACLPVLEATSGTTLASYASALVLLSSNAALLLKPCGG